MRKTQLLAAGAALVMICSTSAAFAKSDQDFLKDAIQGNLAEIAMGQLAQQKGNSEGVKSFGQMLSQDHSAANDKAMSLAKSLGVTSPTEPKPDAKAEQDKLSKLSGEAFDKEFAHHMVADHKKNIAEFNQQAKGSGEVASFAKETVPTLQKHLETAQSLARGKSASR
jgi:putative membrane protein